MAKKNNILSDIGCMVAVGGSLVVVAVGIIGAFLSFNAAWMQWVVHSNYVGSIAPMLAGLAFTEGLLGFGKLGLLFLILDEVGDSTRHLEDIAKQVKKLSPPEEDEEEEKDE